MIIRFILNLFGVPPQEEGKDSSKIKETRLIITKTLINWITSVKELVIGICLQKNVKVPFTGEAFKSRASNK